MAQFRIRFRIFLRIRIGQKNADPDPEHCFKNKGKINKYISVSPHMRGIFKIKIRTLLQVWPVVVKGGKRSAIEEIIRILLAREGYNRFILSKY